MLKHTFYQDDIDYVVKKLKLIRGLFAITTKYTRFHIT